MNVLPIVPVLELRQVTVPAVRQGQALLDTVRDYFRQRALPAEESIAVLVSVTGDVQRIVQLGRGSLTRTPAPAAAIFQAALLEGAGQVAVAHYHPGGSSKPSTADRLWLQQIVDFGRVLDLEVMASLIVNATGEVTQMAIPEPRTWNYPLVEEEGPPADLARFRWRMAGLLGDLRREGLKVSRMLSRLDPSADDVALDLELAQDIVNLFVTRLNEAIAEAKGEDA